MNKTNKWCKREGGQCADYLKCLDSHTGFKSNVFKKQIRAEIVGADCYIKPESNIETYIPSINSQVFSIHQTSRKSPSD